MNESFSTRVSLLPLKGVCVLFWSRALMHSFRASKDLLISAPSNLVCLFWSMTSAPLSLPAKSIKEILPYSWFPLLKLMDKMAWDREESELELFDPVILTELPNSMTYIRDCTELTRFSVSPTILMLALASSLANSCCLSLRRSNNFPQYIS